MILVTLVLPRSRFPMAVHHNKDFTCDVRVVGIGKERGLILTFACLLSLCHLGLFSLYAIMAKGWHSPTSFHTQQVHSSLVVHTHGHGQPRFTAFYTAPPGVNFSTAQVTKRVDSCHSPLNLGQCARSWSSAYVPKASHIEAVHKLHQHFRPFACEMLRAQVRRVCFRGDLLPPPAYCCGPPPGATSTEFFMCFALPKPVLLIMDSAALECQCAVESGRLYPSLWRMPELPSTLLLRGCQRTVLLRRCWWRQCFAASSKL